MTRLFRFLAEFNVRPAQFSWSAFATALVAGTITSGYSLEFGLYDPAWVLGTSLYMMLFTFMFGFFGYKEEESGYAESAKNCRSAGLAFLIIAALLATWAAPKFNNRGMPPKSVSAAAANFV